MVHLDVDHAEPERDLAVDVLQCVEVALRPVRQFEDEMIRVQRVEEICQFLPVALLDRLSAIIAEAEMHGALRALVDRVQHHVHRRGRQRAVTRIAGNVGLVDLDAGRRQPAHLRRQHLGQRHRQLREVAVVVIEQCPREHVGARDRELEGPAAHRRRALAVGEEIEGAFAERAGDHARRLAPETHRMVTGKFLGDRSTHHGRNPRHGANEVFDHPVRVGMIDVEAVKFAVGR